MTHRYTEMNQHDALYKVARQYPGGIEALAQRMGMSAMVLRNKLAPNVSTHRASFEEVSEIMELCQEAGVKDALMPIQVTNWRHGLVAFELPECKDQSDEELASTVMHVMKSVGAVAADAGAVHSKARVDERDRDQMEKDFQEAIAALCEWRERERRYFDEHGAK